MANDGRIGGTGAALGVVAVVVGVAACVGGLSAAMAVVVAVPNFVMTQLRAKRLEVPGNVESIVTAELAYGDVHDAWLPVGSEPEARRSVSTQLRPFRTDEAWTRLGWSPEGDIRGAYWVVVTPAGFEVPGVCDVDGDGVLAEYVAGSDTHDARAITAPDVF